MGWNIFFGGYLKERAASQQKYDMMVFEARLRFFIFLGSVDRDGSNLEFV